METTAKPRHEHKDMLKFDPKRDILTLIIIIGASFVQAIAINGT